MAEQTFDLVVLGGGPGGYVAAIRAAQLGLKTAVVEREHLGGICLNWGCIPTKALLRTSEINHLLHHLPDFGFDAVESHFNIDKVVKRSSGVAKQLSSGVAHLLKKNKVTVFDGAGRLAGKQTVAVTKDGRDIATLKSAHIILATGARARQLPGLETDGKLVYIDDLTLQAVIGQCSITNKTIGLFFSHETCKPYTVLCGKQTRTDFHICGD